MKNIYILLTRSRSMLSRAVRSATGDSYTHVSVAHDDSLTTLCSMGRRYSGFPLPSGLVREDLYDGFFEKNRYIPCALLKLPVEDGIHAAIVERLGSMLDEKELYHYCARGLLRCRLGIPCESERRFFCSQFVATVLRDCGALALPKAPSLMRPQDFLELPGLTCIYEGQLSGLMHSGSDDRLWCLA